MLFKTRVEAMNVAPQIASWKDNVIQRVTMGGRELWRVVVFDYYSKCKNCRGSSGNHIGERHRIPSSGHTCDRCLNPYAGFVRRSAVYRGGVLPHWVVMPHCWGSSGKLH